MPNESLEAQTGTLPELQDVAPPEPEEEERNVIECENCGAEIDLDCENAVMVRTGRRWDSGHYRWRLDHEQWCDRCQCDDAVFIVDWLSDIALRASEGWCSHSFASDNYCYHESSEEWYTYPEESEEEDDSQNDRLLSYSTDIFDVLCWPRENAKNALVFGVELEIEGRGDTYSNDLVDILGGSRGTKTGRAILKYDGSLSDSRGCEIVTLPYTLEQHRKPGLWDVLLDSRIQARARSGAGTTSCGMHVHINRRALSALTVGKMVVFLNNPDNGGFVTTVAQRQSGSYCVRDSAKKHSDALHGYDMSRYDIINISGGATVEVRMFRGNVRPERVLKNIEFCHALVRFCESHGITQAQRWGVFAEWLSKQRKSYPNLYGFLAEKGYFPVPRNAPAPVADA